MKQNYSEITPYLEQLAALSVKNNNIKPELFTQTHVYRGLRDNDGNGVVTGLTEISHIKAKETAPDGKSVPCDGELYYGLSSSLFRASEKGQSCPIQRRAFRIPLAPYLVCTRHDP